MGQLSSPTGEAPEVHGIVTMYTTPWCGYCVRLRRQMTEAGIPFVEVDVDAEPGYDERIIEASGGYRTVPTLEVDGVILVNPTITQLQDLLRGEES